MAEQTDATTDAQTPTTDDDTGPVTDPTDCVIVRKDTASKSDGGDETLTRQSRADFVTDPDFVDGNPERSDDFFRAVATQAFDGFEVDTADDDRSLVAFSVPHWYGNDDDNGDWRQVNGGRFYGDQAFLGVIRWDYCGGKNAWAFDRVFPITGDADGWQSPRNRYGTLWCPRSLVPVWTAAHDPQFMSDTAQAWLDEPLKGDDATPDDYDGRWSSAEYDDVTLDWAQATKDAWDRADTKAANPGDEALAAAFDDAEAKLADRAMDRMKLGLANFMSEHRDLHGEGPDSRMAAAFVRANTAALAPGALKDAGMTDTFGGDETDDDAN